MSKYEGVLWVLITVCLIIGNMNTYYRLESIDKQITQANANYEQLMNSLARQIEERKRTQL